MVKISSIFRLDWLRWPSAANSTPTHSLLNYSVLALLGLLLSFVLLAVVGASGPLLFYWSIWAVHSLVLYGYSTYSLIPRAYPRRRPWLFYLSRFLGMLLLSSLLLFVGLLGLRDNGNSAATFCLPNFGFQLIVAAPATWWLARWKWQHA